MIHSLEGSCTVNKADLNCLNLAASEITFRSLAAAIDAVTAGCQELARWFDLYSRRLDSLSPEQLHKFARALALTLLGHLPTRPATCPFCIQYGHDRACSGCGYAATHGRCDDSASAFSIFIEAFQELGRIIYQDLDGRPAPQEEAVAALRQSISAARVRAGRMAEEVQGCSCQGFDGPGEGTMRLMELKKQYLQDMISLLPTILLSEEVEAQAGRVEVALMNYW